MLIVKKMNWSQEHVFSTPQKNCSNNHYWKCFYISHNHTYVRTNKYQPFFDHLFSFSVENKCENSFINWLFRVEEKRKWIYWNEHFPSALLLYARSDITAYSKNNKWKIFVFISVKGIYIYFSCSMKRNKNTYTNTRLHTHTRAHKMLMHVLPFSLWLLAPSIRSQTMNKNCKIGNHVYGMRCSVCISTIKRQDM